MLKEKQKKSNRSTNTEYKNLEYKDKILIKLCKNRHTHMYTNIKAAHYTLTLT